MKGSRTHSRRIKKFVGWNGCLVAAALTGLAGTARAATLTWDAGGTSPANPVDGSGAWDAGITADWSNVSDPSGQSPNSPADVTWPNTGADTAIFGNGGGTAGAINNFSVTVAAGGVSVGAITFAPLVVSNSGNHSNDYQISGGPITLGQANTVITENNVSSSNLATFPDAELTSQLTGSGGATFAGPGTLAIGNLGTGTAANNYTGTTTITGNVQLGNISLANARTKAGIVTPFGAANNSVILSGGTISTNNSGATQNLPYAFTITDNTSNTIFGSSKAQTFIGGSTGISANPFGSATGSGTLSFNIGGGGTSDLSANFSTFTGTFNLTGGGTTRAFINGGAFSGGTGMALDIESTATVQTILAPQTNSGGNTFNFGSLTSSTANTVLNGGSAGAITYSVGALNTDTTYAGTIGSGTTLGAALTKVGTGSLTLTNTNAYTGATTVNAGALVINGSIASATTVNTGGTLAGTGSIANAVTASGGTISPGATASNSIGTLSVTGNVAFGASSTYLDEINAAGQSDLLAITGNLDLTGAGDTLNVSALDSTSGAPYTIASYTGTLTGTFANTNLPSGYTIDYGTGSNSVIMLVPSSAVPEPASLGLFAFTAAGLGLRRRRV